MTTTALKPSVAFSAMTKGDWDAFAGAEAGSVIFYGNKFTFIYDPNARDLNAMWVDEEASPMVDHCYLLKDLSLEDAIQATQTVEDSGQVPPHKGWYRVL